MKISSALIFTLLILSAAAFGQDVSASRQPASPKSLIAAASTANDLAEATLKAHGGEKLKKMRSFLIKGGADLSFQGQAIPGVFSTAISGEKYYFEIVTAIQQLKQTFDGRETISSIPGFSLPPVTSLGFPLLPKIGDAGYIISELPDGKKKKGFRMTTPEGFYTDFIINDKTGLIKSYESKWMDSADRAITTSVEIDEFQTVDGIVIPKKYSQRFDLGPVTAYANFRAKDILINSVIEDSAFTVKK